MKDKELRERVSRLEQDFNGGVSVQIDGFTRELKDLRIKYCEKCKHETMQKQIILHPNYSHIYLCLNCGTKFECKQETVCKEVK